MITEMGNLVKGPGEKVQASGGWVIEWSMRLLYNIHHHQALVKVKKP
jgi:hypothetical protein